jgi:hypothetical protein
MKAQKVQFKIRLVNHREKSSWGIYLIINNYYLCD